MTQEAPTSPNVTLTPELGGEVVAALRMAVAEMVTLAPRVSPEYYNNLRHAIKKARAALRKVESR